MFGIFGLRFAYQSSQAHNIRNAAAGDDVTRPTSSSHDELAAARVAKRANLEARALGVVISCKREKHHGSVAC